MSTDTKDDVSFYEPHEVLETAGACQSTVTPQIAYKANGDLVDQTGLMVPQEVNAEGAPKAKRKRGRPPGKTNLQLTSSNSADLPSMTAQQHSRKAVVTKTMSVVNSLVESIGSGQYLLDITDKPGMPSYRTVMLWMAQDQDFHDTIKAAYKTWAIAIMGINDKILRGVEGYTTGNFQRDDAIVKRNDRLISKMNVDWFGDKVQVEHTIHQAVILDDSIMGTIVDDGNDGF